MKGSRTETETTYVKCWRLNVLRRFDSIREHDGRRNFRRLVVSGTHHDSADRTATRKTTILIHRHLNKIKFKKVIYTVKPDYNDHHWKPPKKPAVVQRWLLLVMRANINGNNVILTGFRLVFVDRLLLLTGGR